MNPYYATGFLSALFFWVWPAFLFRNLDVHWLTVAFFSALLFLGAGWAVSEFHIRFIRTTGRPARTAVEHRHRVFRYSDRGIAEPRRTSRVLRCMTAPSLK
jgi:hypothetical protein